MKRTKTIMYDIGISQVQQYELWVEVVINRWIDEQILLYFLELMDKNHEEKNRKVMVGDDKFY